MAQGDLILAADFGTSGVKIGLVDSDLRLVAATTEAYPLSLPAPDQAEQAPQDWWQALTRGAARLAAQVPEMKFRTGALAFCAQMCGLVCAGADGAPLRPAMIWLDKRSAPLMRRKVNGFPSINGYSAIKALRWVRVANGGPSLNGMDPAGKMLWIMETEPETARRTAWFMDVRDWLVHRATGEAVTTADSANLTWVMDTRPGREGWSQDLAGRMGLPLERLPRIVPGDAVAGGLTAQAAEDLGLRPGTPVVAGAGDVSAAAIGSGAVADGALHICLASSAWIAGFPARRLLRIRRAYATILAPVDNRPLLIATQESAGAALGWLARNLDPRHPGDAGLNDAYADLGPAREDDPLFLPWLAGERVPADDERLRGSFLGLALGHDAAALKRAAIEGVALNLRWAFDMVAREPGLDGGAPLAAVGGAAANPALMQTVADALDRQVSVGDPVHAGVMGAAALAAPSMGFADTAWQAAAAFRDRPGTQYTPRADRVAALTERVTRLRAARRALLGYYRRCQG